ncbi:MAG TPA: preprotein translocase subunit SecY, partial [Pirellulaceae bacterium]
GQLFEYAALFSAASLRQVTIFGLGIMPYISASIIFQLLGTVWKPMEDLQKEGEAGRKKIYEYTRYATVALCLVQSWVYVYTYMMPQRGPEGSLIKEAFLNSNGQLSLWWQIVAVTTMTCGTLFLMWLGEQIDEFGIGNGISLIIMSGILAQMPAAALRLTENASFVIGGDGINIEKMVLLVVLFVAVVVCIVFMTLGQRRIPTQSAKHVRGRRVMGGTRQYLPLRINQSGVMPIIFASSLLIFPGMIFGWLSRFWPSVFSPVKQIFENGSGLIYNMLYIALIYFFCYFWTAISFNPKDMSENLKNMGTFIPGYRPGKRTADYLEKVMVRITYVGAAFLALVAVIPTALQSALNVDWQIASFYGGTGLLIAVSVVFDLVQKIDSHLVMRNYPGLLEG